jgi:DNA polymerase I-like protein with 3'-5' exonuclease and polymerase domains
MEEYDLFESYARQRDLFKSTTLGLQYGMGYVNLSIKLTADMGYLISPAEAKRLIQLHSRTYPRYWKWLKEIMVSYKVNKCYTLWDGWTLFGDNDNELSVKNFPTQGTGGVIMREAVRLCHNIGINLISPLHDALYALADDDKVEWVRDNMAECMLQAVRNVLGDKLDIRLDIDLHSHEDTWIEGKGARFYHKLKKYLKSGETLEDQMETMKNTIYSTEGRVV